MKIAKFVLPMIVVGFIASSAFAGITLTLTGQATVGGVTVETNRIGWDDAADWTSAALWISLSEGSVVNKQWFNPMTAQIEDQDVVNGFAAYMDPEMAYETYVCPADAGLAGGAGDVGGPALTFGPAEFSVSWFNTATGNFNLQLANIAMTTDAMGVWVMQSGAYIESGLVVNGKMPEPSSLALLALGGLAVLRRR